MKKFETMSDEIVVASDAFFPFVDGIEKLIQSGVKAIIQPQDLSMTKKLLNLQMKPTLFCYSQTRHFRH